MFRKDTLRLMFKTKRRFISLFLIVLIGVGFMVGLLSTHTVMRESVDNYYDENKVFDIQIYSTYGFNEDDIKAIKQTEGVDEVFASKFKDVYANVSEKEGNFVTRVNELDPALNYIKLVEGRKPENDNEALCLSSGSFGDSLPIGTKISLFLNDDEELDKNISVREFEVVGLVDSPLFMASSKETSTLDNKNIDLVIYVNNKLLISDYYTTVYLTLDKAVDQISFTEKYQKFIDDNIGTVELVKAERDGVLKEEIIKDAMVEIEDGEKELEDKKAEAEEKIADAEGELNEGYINLVVAEQQLDTAKETLKTSKKKLDDSKEEVERNLNTVNDGIAAVEKETGKPFEEVVAETTAAYYSYLTLEGQKDKTSSNKEQIDKQIDDLKTRRDEAQAELITLKATEVVKQNNYNSAKNAYDEEKAKLDLETEGTPEYLAQKEIVDQKQMSLNQAEAEYLVAKQNVANKETEITELQNSINRLELLKSQYTDENIQDLLDQINESADGDVKSTYKKITVLAEAKTKLEAAKLEIEQGYTAYDEGLKQLQDSEKEVVKGRNEYEKGLKDLKEAKQELKDEVEEAEEKLANARQDLEELPEAEWMILDRSSHYSSYMYKNNADQMKAIGTYLPLLFFLVAALVCMTTMTRLIDEQRSQIGIFSALGFSKGRIISKYIIYAFLASISGSVFGIVFGMALFPTVIYNCWRLMYNLPPMKIILPMNNVVIGMASFSVLMMFVTYLVARKSLKEMPSQLMRPKPPKNAKKVFLEKIGFIWNHLSFTTKITARNIIRYKSRFFMTVIGVAGCTGLLVVGFGVKDSITDVLNMQYGEVYNYDNSINLDNDHNVDEIISVLEDDLDNQEVVPFMQYSSMTYGEDEKAVTVEVFNPREIKDVINLRDKDNKHELNINGSGVIISEKFARDHGYKAGDTIVFESDSGLKQSFKVDGICEWYIQHYIFISESLYESTFKENVHYNTIAVKTDSPEKIETTLDGVENITSIVDFGPMIESFETMLEALNFIILIIIIAAGSLAFVVLMNLTEVNISERIREIATLKVLGFRNLEVNNYIFKEISLLSLIGAVFGLPLGKIEHHLIMGVIDMEMAKFGDNVKLLSYCYSFGITALFTIIVLLLMKRTLKKIEMVESLKSVE